MQKVTMQDFEQIRCLSQVAFSPNGKAAAYVVSQPSLKENSYLSYIWVLEDGISRKLTAGGEESGFLWLDDQTLLFPGDRSRGKKQEGAQETTVYNRINIHGGEAEPAFTIPMKASGLQKVDDTHFLFIGNFDHYRPDLSGLQGEELEQAKQALEEEKDYEVFDELPFWSNGKGVVNKRRRRLYLFDVTSGECQLLSPAYMNVSSFRYRAQDDLLLYYGHDYEWMDDQKDDMYLLHLNHPEQQPEIQQLSIQLKHRYGVDAADFMGDQLIIAASTGERYGTNENPTYFTADLHTGALTQLCDLDPSMGSSVGSDCRHGGGTTAKTTDTAWYYTETRGFNSCIVRLDQDGKETRITPQVNGSVDCFDYFDGTFLYVAMRENGLQELYRCREDGSGEQQLTHLNDEFLASRTVAPLHYLPFTDSDGVQLDGWVIEPVGYDPSKRYPAILDVHGGPKTVYGEVFFHEMQLWASEGYFVFFCNPRGGDGRGNEFADIRGKRYGVWDYNDLMEFTDHVLQSYPQIDPARVGMTGGSYGGFMANWIVGHTDRFAAVASQRSIANFISKCLTTDIGYYHNLCAVQSDPWNSPEEMWNRSPLKYADKCTTPTLFIQSDEDYRCWMADALQMFTALRMHGVPTRVCLFHGENHELSRNGKPKHRVRRLKEITRWFDRYLKNC